MAAAAAAVVVIVVHVVVVVDKGRFKHGEQRRHRIVERENGRVCIHHYR